MATLFDYGFSENRIRAIFREQWYLEQNPDIHVAGGDPFDHYFCQGFAEERSPNSLFIPGLYRRMSYVGGSIPTIVHYLTQTDPRPRDPHPLLSSSWYRQQPPACQTALTDLEEYLITGRDLVRDPHPLFSTAWYLERSNINDLEGLTPLEHYLTSGWKRGFQPSALFRPEAYRSQHVDLGDETEPLTHYVLFGQGHPEYRFVTPFFDERFYEKQVDDEEVFRRGLLAHFAEIGGCRGLVTSAEPLSSKVMDQLLRQQNRARASLKRTDESCEVMPFVIDWDGRAREITLKPSDAPAVSIIIPTLDHSEDVIRCLESLADLPDVTPYEIVVVDDGSSRLHAGRLELISGINLHVLAKNLGFAGATASGIEASRGDFIVLLNNDTEVLPGWLDSLVDTISSSSEIGVVGSMILRPDLRLQEAGCVVFRDGDARQLGCREWPTDWRYQVSRDVDYCSGASLIFRRSFWNDVGGFDPRFAPAYYEDTDLAMTARSRGLRVVYQPQSVLFHNEGTTHGREFVGVKKIQLRNQKLFAEKWAEQLATKPVNPRTWLPKDEWAVRDQSSDRVVVVIDHRVPEPTQDSGSVRMANVLNLLRELGHRVVFVPENGARPQPASSHLETMGVEIFGWSSHDDSFRSYLESLSSRIEFVLASRPDVALNVFSIVSRALPTTPFVYDMVDAHGLRKRNEAIVSGNGEDLREAFRVESVERRMARVSDVVVTLSEDDEREIRRLASADIETIRISNIHMPVDPGPGRGDRAGILFVGGYEHSPNVDAAVYFVREVLPLLDEELGPIQLTLAGSKPSNQILSLAGPNIIVPGWVEDLTNLYHQSLVAIAPLRFGAGVKGKIGEALSYGVPVVSTSIGVTGMGLRDGIDVLIGDTPQEFARAISQLVKDPILWSAIRDAGLSTVNENFGWSHSRLQVATLIAKARDLKGPTP